MLSSARARFFGLPVLGLLAALLFVPVVTAPADAAGPGCGLPVPVGDCTAPTTKVTSRPADNTTSTTAQFTFEPQTQESGVTWQCRLDRGATPVSDWANCTDTSAAPGTSSGSATYQGLVPGQYTFSVVASDNAMPSPNVENPATTVTWTIQAPAGPPDTQAPQTTITSGPSRWLTYNFVGIQYTSDDGSTQGYLCTLDGRSRSCSSGGEADFFQLGAGDHTFTVAAIDAAGNVDPTPAQARWTIPADQTAAHFSKGWTRKRGSSYTFDDYKTTTTNGAQAYQGRNGFRSAALVTTKCPTCGKVDVYLGKVRLERVSLSAAKLKHKTIVLGSWSKLQTKRITLKVVTSGKRVVVDGLGLSRYQK